MVLESQSVTSRVSSLLRALKCPPLCKVEGLESLPLDGRHVEEFVVIFPQANYTRPQFTLDISYLAT
jgi:hypothetical protein